MIRCFVNTGRVEGIHSIKNGVMWSLCLLIACLRYVLKFDEKSGIYGLCRMASNMSNVHKQAVHNALKVSCAIDACQPQRRAGPYLCAR